MALTALFILNPVLVKPHEDSLRLGNDWPVGLLEDAQASLSAESVATLPQEAFTPLQGPLNAGYTRSTYWLRFAPPVLAFGDGGGASEPLWLEVLPPYLDEVRLYQHDGTRWQMQRHGDTVPPADRVRVRQLLFPLASPAAPLQADTSERPLLLRLQTSGTVQLHGRIWRDSDLLVHLARAEWAEGVHLGINLVLALLIGGAALALRTRSLTATAVLAFLILLHGLSVRGYIGLWLPHAKADWADLAVKLSVFAMPAALTWQGRELFTRGTAWRRIDRSLLTLLLLQLLAMLSVPTSHFEQWAWFGLFSPWLATSLCAIVACADMHRKGVTTLRLLIAAPYVLSALTSLHVGANYTGLITATRGGEALWQPKALLLELLLTIAIGARLVVRFQQAQSGQQQLVQSLAQSEQMLDARVQQRTAELVQTQSTLQATLERKRQIRHEQRQFFGMVNHEFRTPLTVIDGAATEQMAFPSTDAAAQVEVGTQIRKACRRLSTLMDNCLVRDRMDADAFRLELRSTDLPALVEDAALLVRWSRRHTLTLDVAAAPQRWVCDAVLLHMALSNLVDNAVKYGSAGHIDVAARLDAHGALCLSVSDAGPGLRAEVAEQLFERGQRAEHRVGGFGLGLWVARRIARLHGGDIQTSASILGGSCFCMRLPPLPLDDGLDDGMEHHAL